MWSISAEAHIATGFNRHYRMSTTHAISSNAARRSERHHGCHRRGVLGLRFCARCHNINSIQSFADYYAFSPSRQHSRDDHPHADGRVREYRQKLPGRKAAPVRAKIAVLLDPAKKQTVNDV